jgi:hypothetical protein
MSQCSLVVQRGASEKYVQFSASSTLLPPLLFDLTEDPSQVHNLCAHPAGSERAWQAAAQLLQWRMRYEERILSGSLLDAELGLVERRDLWR